MCALHYNFICSSFPLYSTSGALQNRKNMAAYYCAFVLQKLLAKSFKYVSDALVYDARLSGTVLELKMKNCEGETVKAKLRRRSRNARVYVRYRSRIARIFVTCRHGRIYLWKWSLIVCNVEFGINLKQFWRQIQRNSYVLSVERQAPVRVFRVFVSRDKEGAWRDQKKRVCYPWMCVKRVRVNWVRL